jgi:putative membrane protein
LLLLLTVFPLFGSLKNDYNIIWLILLLVGLQIVIWPLLIHGFLRLFKKIPAVILLIVFPVIFLVLPAFIIMIADWLSSGLEVNGFGSALVIASFMSIIFLIFSSLFFADDELVIFRWMLRKNSPAITEEDSGKPGIIFLEIDGLSGQVLRNAMAMGKATNMKRWLDCGSHKMVSWETDLSSQTSAAQAGILHGNNFGIPAFRWYDKAKKEIVVSSSIKDVSELEKRLSDGKGLLCQGGTARGCLFSGDASQVLMTASRVMEVTSADLQAYYLNPSNILRTFLLMVWDWILEKRAAWSQRLRDEKPRVKRGGIYFFLRSCMTVLLRDFTVFALKGDMYSGVPYAYATLAGYDEVSHHSGTQRPDSLEVLRKLDREFEKLEKIAQDAHRKYRLVVLSDHGHTQGTTFSERYKEKLEDVVTRLIHTSRKEYRITGYETYHESAYYIDAAFKDYRFSNSRTFHRFRNTLVGSQQVKIGKGEQDDVIVLASGNLGLMYFPKIDHRVTLEELMQELPGLLPGLVEHPGIGFVTLRSAEKGTVVMGKHGKIYLDTGKTEGENPLTDYGPLTFSSLVRADSFPNAPDITIMSTYWKDTDEVAAFEELVSSHGGAGGAQSRPFILYPAELDLGTEKIEGAEAVYKIFKGWTSEIQKP